MSAASNSPSRSPFAAYNEHQLLVMILTELRILTRLIAEETDSKEDFDQLRVEAMNDADIFTGDGG